MPNRSKQIGGQYRFTYTNYGSPEVHPDFRAHSGQLVTITRQIGEEVAVAGGGNKYMIKAADGWTGLALGSELRTDPKLAARQPARKKARQTQSMPIKSIFNSLPDKTLAAIAKKVNTKHGTIFIDEDTRAFLYSKAGSKPFLYIIDSDNDFMRLPAKYAGRGHSVVLPSDLLNELDLLERLDIREFRKVG